MRKPPSPAVILRARRNGIKMPVLAARATALTGIPYPVICAMLVKETAGGQNIYGHDVDSRGYPRPMGRPPGVNLKVTSENYHAYLGERDAFLETKIGRRMQGVGPMQLTWYEFQDRADAEGGCWRPSVNILTGSRILMEWWHLDRDWRDVARRWNSNPGYADEFVILVQRWRKTLSAAG